MQLSIDISKTMETLLQGEWGDLSPAAKEALAIESYRQGKLSLDLLAEMPGVVETDA